MAGSPDLKSTSSGEVLSWVCVPGSHLHPSGRLQEQCGGGGVFGHATGQMSSRWLCPVAFFSRGGTSGQPEEVFPRVGHFV